MPDISFSKPELFELLKSEILTEENTDQVLAWLRAHYDIPGIPDEIVYRILDYLLPGMILKAFEKVLIETA